MRTLQQPDRQWRLAASSRDWQIRALEAWRLADMRGIVSVVTGGGKTIFAELCMLAFRERFPDGRVVIVVPTLALLDQWYVSLRDDLRVGDDEMATYSGEGRPVQPSVVNLLVLNTARDAVAAIGRSSPVLLIVDEVHRAASPANLRALELDTVASLGMSATPEREYDEWLQEHVVPLVGDIIFRYGYEQARADGVIAPFDLYNVEVPLRRDEAQQYDKASRRVALLMGRLKKGEDVHDRVKIALRQRASVGASASMRIPIATKLLDEHRGRRAIVFHERISAAEELSEIIAARGHRTTVYHSRIDGPVRRDNLRLYRAGIFDVLVTCRALDEGVNVPETEVAVVASSTASTRQRIQRLGRVLRPAPGKARARIYTLYATPVEGERLRREAEAGTGADSVTWLRGTVDQPRV